MVAASVSGDLMERKDQSNENHVDLQTRLTKGAQNIRRFLTTIKEFKISIIIGAIDHARM